MDAETTTNQEKIRQWAEEHDAKPAKIETPTKVIIKFALDTYTGEKLEYISWEEFFEIFEEDKLALKYENNPDKSDLFELLPRKQLK